MKNKIIAYIKKNCQIITIIGLSAFLTFFCLGNQSFGFDESFSMYITKDWPLLLTTIWNHEANMWLYYMLLHFWRVIGINEFAVRSLSAIFAVATIPVLYLLGKFIANKRVGLMASLLTTVSIAYILYAQEARSYSLVLFLVSLSSYAFLRYNENKLYKIIFILSGALSIYAHFYAGLVLLAQTTAAFLRERCKQFILAVAIIFILLLPLALSPSIHSHQIDWITKPTLTSIGGVAFFLSGDFPPLFVLYGLIFLFGIPFFIRNIRNRKYAFLFGWLIIPVAVAFIFSVCIKPLYESTYFIICLPPFILLSAIFIDSIKGKWLKTVLLITLVVLSLIRLILWYIQDENFKWIIDNEKYDWRPAISYVSSHAQKEDTLIVYPYQDKLLYSAYTTHQQLPIAEVSSKPYLLSGGKTLPEPNSSKLLSLKNSHIWVLLHIVPEEDFDHNKKQADEMISILSKNYTIDYSRKYFDIELVHFTKRYE